MLPTNYVYFKRNCCLMLASSLSCTKVLCVRASLRFLDFFVKMWLLNACFLLIFPEPVSLKRFLALDFVFIFGMFCFLFSYSLYFYFLIGAINIIIRLPSNFGICSTFPSSSKSCAKRNNKI